MLNYKNYGDTIECLRSLLGIDYREREIIVVDNDSQNDSLEHIVGFLAEIGVPVYRVDEDAPESATERDEAVYAVQSSSNRGYAAGNNVGIRVALARDAAYVLILNNDTVVDPDFLGPLVQYLEAHPMVAAAGPLLLDPDRQIGRYSARRRPRPGDLFFTLGLGRKLFPKNRWLRSLTYEGEYDFDHPREVDVLSGSCMLVRSRALRDMGLLDEGTFLFEEEYIFHERLRAAGLASAIVPRSTVVHKHSQSTLKTPRARLQAILEDSQKYYWTRYRRYSPAIASLLVVSGRFPNRLSTALRRRRG